MPPTPVLDKAPPKLHSVMFNPEAPNHLDFPMPGMVLSDRSLGLILTARKRLSANSLTKFPYDFDNQARILSDRPRRQPWFETDVSYDGTMVNLSDPEKSKETAPSHTGQKRSRYSSAMSAEDIGRTDTRLDHESLERLVPYLFTGYGRLASQALGIIEILRARGEGVENGSDPPEENTDLEADRRRRRENVNIADVLDRELDWQERVLGQYLVEAMVGRGTRSCKEDRDVPVLAVEGLKSTIDKLVWEL